MDISRWREPPDHESVLSQVPEGALEIKRMLHLIHRSSGAGGFSVV